MQIAMNKLDFTIVFLLLPFINNFKKLNKIKFLPFLNKFYTNFYKTPFKFEIKKEKII